MPVATPSRPSPRPSASSKMDKDKIEDRKRPSGASDDGAPPRKKMAVNGGVAKDEHDNQAEEVWIEVSSSAPSAMRFYRGDFPPTDTSIYPLDRFPGRKSSACSLLCHLQSGSSRWNSRSNHPFRQFRQQFFPAIRRSLASAIAPASTIIVALPPNQLWSRVLTNARRISPEARYTAECTSTNARLLRIRRDWKSYTRGRCIMTTTSE